RGRRRDQRLDLDPSAVVEGEPDALGLMAQMLGEVLRHLDGASFVHPFRLPGETRITRSVLLRRFDPQPSAVIHRGFGDSVDNRRLLPPFPPAVPARRPRPPSPPAVPPRRHRSGGFTRAISRSAPGIHRARTYAVRASTVTGTTASSRTTARRTAAATRCGG